MRAAREILSQADIARYVSVERLPGLDARSDSEIMAYVRQYACCDYHPVGTCKMGVDEAAVVDPELRVRHVEEACGWWIPSISAGHRSAATPMRRR